MCSVYLTGKFFGEIITDFNADFQETIVHFVRTAQSTFRINLCSRSLQNVTKMATVQDGIVTLGVSLFEHTRSRDGIFWGIKTLIVFQLDPWGLPVDAIRSSLQPTNAILQANYVILAKISIFSVRPAKFNLILSTPATIEIMKVRLSRNRSKQYKLIKALLLREGTKNSA